jgi:hypothetical protein
MADNPAPPGGETPAGSTSNGPPPLPTTLPARKSVGAKVLVMLSSVAKAPPPAGSATPAALPPTVPALRPPVLPKRITMSLTPKDPTLPPGGGADEVVLPPKTGAVTRVPVNRSTITRSITMPPVVTIAEAPAVVVPPVERKLPPPLPIPVPAPVVVKAPEPVLPPPPSEPQSLEAFNRSQAPAVVPAAPIVEPKDVVAPPGPFAPSTPTVPPLANEKEAAPKLPPPQMPPESPRVEAPPMVNLKSVPGTGGPVRLPAPPSRTPKGKVLESIETRKLEIPTVPPTVPVPGAPVKGASPTTPVPPLTPPGAKRKSLPSFLFARSPRPNAKLAAPVKPGAAKAAPATPAAPAAAPISSPAPVAAAALAAVATAATVAAVTATPPPATPIVPGAAGGKTPITRNERIRRKRLMGDIAFYVLFAVSMVLLYFGTLYFTQQTRIEGQAIPPEGMKLGNEAWIVGDFRELASGIADDLAAERAPKLVEIQEKQQHVQSAQADIAAREERIRLLQDQVQSAKDEIAATIKQARDASQAVWDGPGAQLEAEYNAKLDELQQTIANRARALKLNYQPDNTYHSPEVWANAYRLALYETPPGVDGVKEHTWLEAQLKAWRDFTKTIDDRQNQLRQQAAQIQLSPTAKVTDLNGKIDELRQRITATQAEEDPLKAELQEAQADLSEVQASESGLDAKYYKQLYALPESNVTKRLPIAPNGRFSWPHVEKDSAFAAGDPIHHYWIFVRAVRPDGRQFWAMNHFDVEKNHPLLMTIEPTTFVSTKKILRPDLSPDEQEQ